MGPSDAQLAWLRMSGFERDSYYDNVWIPPNKRNHTNIRWDKHLQEFKQYGFAHECEWTHDFVLPPLNKLGDGPNS